MKSFIVLSAVLLASAYASPVPSKGFGNVVGAASEDVTNLVKAKGAVLTYTANAAAEALGAAGNATFEYVSNIEPIQALDKAEEEVIARKVASIEAAFDTKRAIVKQVQDLTEKHRENVIAVLNGTVRF